MKRDNHRMTRMVSNYSGDIPMSLPFEAYSGTQNRRNFGRLKATLGDFSLFCPKLRAILGDLRRFWATLGNFR